MEMSARKNIFVIHAEPFRKRSQFFYQLKELTMAAKKPTTKGLQFPRRFTKEAVNVFDQFTYDYRTSVIRTPTGEVVFEVNNVEGPSQASQIATDILAQKYFRKAGLPQPDGSLGRETTGRQGAHRMANRWKVG